MQFADVGRLNADTLGRVLVTIAVAAVVQLMVLTLISGIIRRVVRPHYHGSEVEEKKREDTLISIFRTATAAVVWLCTGIIVLAEFHVNVTTLVTSAGLIGVILGLGAQSTIKSYLAGLFIITEDQYRVGDIITLDGLGVSGGVSGVVEDISIRITKLRDLDGNLHIITNGTADVITNRTFQYANVNIDVNVSYEADVNKVEAVINEVGAKLAMDPQWKEKVAEPIQFIRVDGFNDSSVTIKSIGKVRPGSQWDVAGEFRRRLLPAFKAAKIDIPYPQLVVRDAKKGKK